MKIATNIIEDKRIPGGLGRTYMPDNRDSNFKMSSVLPATTSTRASRYWNTKGWVGDQGYTSQCVAYAWLHWLEDGPITHNIAPSPMLNPEKAYKAFQRNDEWAGEAYEGTSVRAGAKVLQKAGLIDSYYWSTSVNELAQAILNKGPVVVGTNWYPSMFYPDQESGILHLYGSPVGGHAYIVNGVNMDKQLFRCKNSWGQDFGKNGLFYIRFVDMGRLLREQGECCLAVEKKTDKNFVIPVELK